MRATTMRGMGNGGSWLVWALLLLAASGLEAAGPSPWTVEDVLLAEDVGEMRLSPDGAWALWSKVGMDAEEGKRVSNLFLTRLADGREIQLTRGPHRHTSPRWSPDGELVSFLSDRPAPAGEGEEEDDLADTQLWLMRPQGGEPWRLTQLQRSIRDYGWKDAGSLVFAAQEDPTLYEKELEEAEDTSQVVEDAQHEPPVRLFLLDAEDGRIRRLTDDDDWIRSLSISPDGRWAVVRADQDLSFPFDHEVRPHTYLVDLATGSRQRLFGGGEGGPGPAGPDPLVRAVVWEPGSEGFYVAVDVSSHPRYLMATVTRLLHYELAAERTREVDLGWPRGLGRSDSLHATADGFIALLADGVRFQPARYSRSGDGWSRELLAGEHAENLFAWEVGRDGTTLVYEHSTAGTPPQWYTARLGGDAIEEPRRITRLNPDLDERPPLRTEVVRWRGARDDEVEGILYYPMGYEEGGRHPLVLSIHGGPAGADLDAWSHSWAQPKVLLAQRGAFVLEVNYHGSSNYGLEWVESIGGGRYYELEIPDIEAGVEHLVAAGLVDRRRLATTGWSNGGILSIELITRNPHYKAASIGAADVEWISDWGNVDFGAAFDNYYFGASPLEDPQLYVEKSPFFRLDRVETPTIVHTGTEDRNVPPSQSWSLFRALQQLGKTEVRFLLYPGEPHGLRKYAHQKRKLEEDLRWLDRHLFATAEAAVEAMKEGSPLERALALAKAAQSGGRLGRALEDGTLVPETVRTQGLALGRFEVTRAQLAASDPAYTYPPGTGDYPAGGLSFARARRYAAWLSELTGETWRLPRVGEVEALYEKARGEGNTLDHWAGYTPNPDEAEALLAQAAELPGDAPLLLEVGSFPGLGDDPVFDLGGNLAEWTVAEDGSGRLLGGSADRSSDPKSTATAGRAYRGLRVVREAAQGEPLR